MPAPRITRLRTNHLVDPLGVDTRWPRFSWWTEGDADAAAFDIEVHGGSRRRPAWRSGWLAAQGVPSARYAGRPLRSREQLSWRVRMRDAGGAVSEWSEPARLEMGLLRRRDWTAQWIHDTARERRDDGRPSRLRTVVVLPDVPLVQARLYVSALGIAEPWINGRRVGDDRFSPGWTDYHRRVRYWTHDVAQHLAAGENVVGAVVADGWYAGSVAWLGTAVYGRFPSLLMQVEAILADGRTVTCATGAPWQAQWDSRGRADLLLGEFDDVRVDDSAWCTADAPPDGWRGTAATSGARARLVAAAAAPVREIERIAAVTMPAADSAVRADIGENIVGVAVVGVTGPFGSTVTLRHAEMLDAEGRLYTANLRGADATDSVVLGAAATSWSPRFTSHGFRYVEACCRGGASLTSVHGSVLATDMPTAGGFTCSDSMLERLHANVVRSLRGNTVGLPTDCPQRDERLGWLCDTQLFAPTMLYLVDAAAFLGQWMQDVIDARSSRGAFSDMAPRIRTTTTGARWRDGAPGWADAAVIVPWLLYRHAGDLDVAERHFEALDRWIRLVDSANPGHQRRHLRGNDWGDWLAVGEETSKDLIADAYWALSTGIMARLARLLGREQRACELDTLHAAVRERFVATHVGDDGVVGSGTQTAQVLALAFGVLDDGRPAAAHLAGSVRDAGWHLRTGFLGTPHLLGVLRDHGHTDVAWRVLLQTTYPSWGYQVRHGATTMWERWDSWTAAKGFATPFMNSFNHCALGSVATFLHETVGGLALDPDVPAYRRVRVAPMPVIGMSSASTWHDGPFGRTACAWTVQGRRLELRLSLPPGTAADVQLPGAGESIVAGPGEHTWVVPDPALVAHS